MFYLGRGQDIKNMLVTNGQQPDQLVPSDLGSEVLIEKFIF